MATVETFEVMLAKGQDTAMVRYALGNEYLKAGDAARAAEHLQAAVARDPKYSAAWKLLGRALNEAGRPSDAVAAYREGIAVATARGDLQAAKEMTVFARRIEAQGGKPLGLESGE